MLPQDTKDPPVVFHLLPFVGSTIAYSRNPTKFLEIARKKVCLEIIYLKIFLMWR